MPRFPRPRIPNPEGPYPPLPDPIPPRPEPPDPIPIPDPTNFRRFMPPELFRWPPEYPTRIRSLRCGCYLLNFTPRSLPLLSYDGTLRVECHGAGRTASGDLYQRRMRLLPWDPRLPRLIRPAFLMPGPNPANGIPIFDRDRYRYYLQVTRIVEWFTLGNEFTLGFTRWRFTKGGTDWADGGSWNNDGDFTAEMKWQTAPSGYPRSNDYLVGDVKDSNGVLVGRLSMGWISKYLRKATIEIDRVSRSEAPLDNGSGVDWRAVGDSIDWDLTVDESDSNVAEPSGDSWSDGEIHEKMLARRDASNLDAEWRYHVMCVRNLDSTSRGIMYDAYGGDSNKVPREGCAIASHWDIPDENKWGSVRGMRFGTASAPYFRTAVHETGHAMGLYHNTDDNGFMNTTGVIASDSLSAGSPSFPDNVQWSYNAEDAKRLRHMPDVHVRPGCLPFGVSYPTSMISPTDLEVELEGLTLQVTPVLDSVPLGAPVRVDLELKNTSDQEILAPTSLSMRSGLVRGEVIDSNGTVREFSPIVLCIDDHLLAPLAPKQSVKHSLTLLRGPQAALFPVAGVHRIVVEVSWENGGVDAVLRGETRVSVSAAVDEQHEQLASRLLTAPDTLLTLVFGGDHLDDGIAPIRAALEHPVLRPHFAYIEAKRLATRFHKRKPDLEGAAKLIDGKAVMSSAERDKATKLLDKKKSKSAVGVG